jgi:hypothetical protein
LVSSCPRIVHAAISARISRSMASVYIALALFAHYFYSLQR